MVAQIDSIYWNQCRSRVPARLLSYALFEGRPLTTRGRFVNPAVKGLAGLLSKFSDDSEVDRPIFVVGLGRSGTTVLGTILSTHGEVGFLNEPKLHWSRLHPKEDLIGSYTTGDCRYRLGREDVDPDKRLNARRYLSAYLRCIGRKRLVDKYPELVFRRDFVRTLFPDAPFVVLMRDAPAAISSIVRWSEDHATGSGAQRADWWGTADRKWKALRDQVIAPDPAFASIRSELDQISSDEERAALEWVATTRDGLRLCRELPGSALLVRYESLTAAPGAEMQRILDHCELSRDLGCLDYAVNRLVPARQAHEIGCRPSIRALVEETRIEAGYVNANDREER